MKIHQHIHKHIYGHTYTRPHTHPYTPGHKEGEKTWGKACNMTRKSGEKEVRIRKGKDGRADPRTGLHREMLYLQGVRDYKKEKEREKKNIKLMRKKYEM